MDYTVNSLIRYETGCIERVLWFDSEYTYVINININSLPYQKKTDDLNESLKKGTIELLIDDPFTIIYQEDELPHMYKEKRDKAWNMIKEIVSEEPMVYRSKYRSRYIEEIAHNNSITELSVLNYIKRFWRYGKTPNALIPLYQNCGGKGKEKTTNKVKRGRPRDNQTVCGIGINVSDDIKKIFVKAINRYYYTTAKNSLVRTYELMRKEYFVNGYNETNGVKVPILMSQAEIPSFGQFRYWFEKQRDIKKEIVSRYSQKRYLKNYRAVTGNANDGIIQPGIYEIDTQIGDIYLVSRFNRSWIVGRPIIVAIIDKFSKIIAGVYVGIESASYATAMMAIYNAVSNKVDFCRKYGIDINQDEWPVAGLPLQIVADRGELEGYNVNNLINTLNINVQITPSYRGDLKPNVEKFHDLLNQLIKPHLPGVINLDGRERGDKDYRTLATLDIYQFTQVVIKAILYYNNYNVLDNYKRNNLMVADNVLCVPREIYNWGIANYGGTLRYASDLMLKLALMPLGEATVTAKGVRFKNIYYASKSMLQKQIFVKARQKTWKVKINYDPRDLTYIYILEDKPGEYEKCSVIDANSRYKDKVIEEVDNLLSMEKAQQLSLSDVDAQAKAQLITEIEDIVKNSKEVEVQGDIESDFKISDKKRVENIRENRRIEKTNNRIKEVFEVGESLERDHRNTGEQSDEEESTIDLLYQKQKEGLSNV